MITHERLTALLSYDSETGIFRWRANGKIAGCLTKRLYVHIMIDGSTYLAHRLAWFYHYAKWPESLVDHKDRDKSNNRIVNLREVSASLNRLNANPGLTNTSGYVGVSFDAKARKWKARVGNTYLGLFALKEDAATVVAEYKETLFNP